MILLGAELAFGAFFFGTLVVRDYFAGAGMT
jgi:hypothetical protein